MLKGYVSLRQASILLGVSYPTILKWKNNGDIETLKLGGIFYVPHTEMQRLFPQSKNPVQELKDLNDH